MYLPTVKAFCQLPLDSWFEEEEVYILTVRRVPIVLGASQVRVPKS